MKSWSWINLAADASLYASEFMLKVVRASFIFGFIFAETNKEPADDIAAAFVVGDIDRG